MATDPRAETIRLLTSIDQCLAGIHDMLVDVLEKLEDIALNPKPSAPPVNDRVCDGPKGDPIVKVEPRDWTGEPMKGRHFSECPPAWLDLAAEMYDYFAGKSEDATKKRYNELDASRARGWASRLRAGWTAPVPVRGEHEPDW